MRKIEEMIADAILHSIEDNEGTFNVDAECDDITVEVSGRYQYRSVTECIGLGRYITDTLHASVEIDSVKSYDESGNKINTDFDVEGVEEHVCYVLYNE